MKPGQELDAPTPFDVVVIGNIGIDINVFHPGGEIDFSREANFTNNLFCVGHAGGYSSRGYAQLGRKTAFIGHVGDDFSGEFIRRELSGDGIDCRELMIDPAGTSSSVNLMLSQGRRKNFYDGKSHMHLVVDPNACADLFQGARLAHVHLPNWARHLLPVARQQGLTLACDLQDVTHVDDPYRLDFIESCDILFFSAVNAEDDHHLLRQFLESHPSKLFVMGRGARGCAVGHEEQIHTFPPLDLDWPIVDTNGAGDALAVGFLTSYVLDKGGLETDEAAREASFAEAVLRGQIAARHACAQKASSRTLIRADVLERVAASLRLDA